MDLDNVAKRICEQIEEDHEWDLANLLEESLNNCLERSPPYQTRSFLNPRLSFTQGAHQEHPRLTSSFMTRISYNVSYRLALVTVLTNSHKDFASINEQKVHVAVKDVSQLEPAKIPEYSRYIAIERSFHAHHPEVRCTALKFTVSPRQQLTLL